MTIRRTPEEHREWLLANENLLLNPEEEKEKKRNYWRLHLSNPSFGFHEGETFLISNDDLNELTRNKIFSRLIMESVSQTVLQGLYEQEQDKWEANQEEED